jgi:hypothetical protein
MEQVRLKVRMLIGGKWFKDGSIVDKDEIPPQLHKRAYLSSALEDPPPPSPEDDDEQPRRIPLRKKK